MLLQRFTAESLKKQRKVSIPYPPLQIVHYSVTFSLYFYPLSALFLNPISTPSFAIPFSLLIISFSSYDKDFKFHYILFHQWHISLHSVSQRDIFFE